jgi:hypothetical protein
MAFTQWTLTDNSTGTPVVWTFPMNPREFTHPGRQASVVTETTTGSIGGTIMFQGQDAVPTLSFAGTINSETFYTQLRAELNKWYDLILTDDQGTSWSIIIDSFTMERKKSALNQHRYTYNVTAKVIA